MYCCFEALEIFWCTMWQKPGSINPTCLFLAHILTVLRRAVRAKHKLAVQVDEDVLRIILPRKSTVRDLAQ